MYDSKNFDCVCNLCHHKWRARADIPKKCPKCGNGNWNKSVGSRHFETLILRSCGKIQDSEDYSFCKLETVERPDIITEDTIIIKSPDIKTYLNRAHFPIGSALILIGDMEVLEDGTLEINSMNLIFIIEASFRIYTSFVSCPFNINDMYARRRAYAAHQANEAKVKEHKEAQKKVNLEAQKEELRLEEERLRMKRQLLAEIEGDL